MHHGAVAVDEVDFGRIAIGTIEQEAVIGIAKLALARIELQIQVRALVHVARAVDVYRAIGRDLVLGHVIVQALGANHGVATAQFGIAFHGGADIGLAGDGFTLDIHRLLLAHGIGILVLQQAAGTQWRRALQCRVQAGDRRSHGGSCSWRCLRSLGGTCWHRGSGRLGLGFRRLGRGCRALNRLGGQGHHQRAAGRSWRDRSRGRNAQRLGIGDKLQVIDGLGIDGRTGAGPGQGDQGCEPAQTGALGNACQAPMLALSCCGWASTQWGWQKHVGLRRLWLRKTGKTRKPST